MAVEVWYLCKMPNIKRKKSLPDTRLKTRQVCLEKITTDPDQYMLANPDTYGISVLEFSYVTVLPDPDLPKNKISKQRRFGLVTEPCALFT
jgi:hypothetical protein